MKHMKQYNKELAEDISLLKAMHTKKDKSGFNTLKEEIMRKHNISKATVYRELKKDMPGAYKTPNYNPPKMEITTEEALMVRELLLQGRQNQEIMKIMTRELGIHYYWDRFDRVRKMAEELDENVYDINRSYFPERGNMFFERILGTEYMAEGAYKLIDIDGKMIRISKNTLDMFKVYVMRDNPISGEPPQMNFLENEIIFHAEITEGLRRKLNMMHKTGEMPSAYALRSLMETKQLIEKRENTIIRHREILLKERKLLEERNLSKENYNGNRKKK